MSAESTDVKVADLSLAAFGRIPGNGGAALGRSTGSEFGQGIEVDRRSARRSDDAPLTH